MRALICLIVLCIGLAAFGASAQPIRGYGNFDPSDGTVNTKPKPSITAEEKKAIIPLKSLDRKRPPVTSPAPPPEQPVVIDEGYARRVQAMSKEERRKEIERANDPDYRRNTMQAKPPAVTRGTETTREDNAAPPAPVRPEDPMQARQAAREKMERDRLANRANARVSAFEKNESVFRPGDSPIERRERGRVDAFTKTSSDMPEQTRQNRLGVFETRPAGNIDAFGRTSDESWHYNRDEQTRGQRIYAPEDRRIDVFNRQPADELGLPKDGVIGPSPAAAEGTVFAPDDQRINAFERKIRDAQGRIIEPAAVPVTIDSFDK